MNKRAKLLLTMAGVGIIGMLSGCGTSQPIDTVMSAPPITPELIEIPESTEEAVSGNESVSPSAPSVSDETANDTSKQEMGNSLSNNYTDRKVTEDLNSSEPDPEPNYGQEVIALTDSLEEAEKIAELYGINLKSFDLGVAVYTTDKDIAALIQMGKDNGYPELSINRQVQLLQ